jgi:UDP-N-acetylmuramoyl-tripeptide--D-alanyl-D-alanine ligase
VLIEKWSATTLTQLQTNLSVGKQASSLTIENLVFDKITYDSRQVTPASLFVAMRGEVSDGHLFIADAIERGATALMVRSDWLLSLSVESSIYATLSRVPVIVVTDTLDALQDLVVWWRNRYPHLQAVGITGSVGKSSTKELIAAVLSQHYNTFKSPKNINDQQSLMPELLKLQPTHQRAVIEMGAGWVFGELTRLCRVVQPRIGVVLSVSHSHIGRMLSLEKIAQAKAELVQALPDDGFAVLNGDDERVRAMAKLTKATPFFFGLKPEYDLWADEIESLGLDGLAFTVHYQAKSYHLNVPFTGRHFVTNLLAAIAVGLLEGLSWDEISRGLQLRDAQIRLVVVDGPSGSTIIDDTYNASPVSTVAALDFLADIAAFAARSGQLKRKIAVLGDMLELGSYEREAHEIVGKRAAQVSDWLLVIGELGQIIGETALANGFDPTHLIFAQNKAELVAWLWQNLNSNDYVLVKASHGMSLEQVVAQLLEKTTQTDGKAEAQI